MIVSLTSCVVLLDSLPTLFISMFVLKRVISNGTYVPCLMSIYLVFTILLVFVGSTLLNIVVLPFENNLGMYADLSYNFFTWACAFFSVCALLFISFFVPGRSNQLSYFKLPSLETVKSNNLFVLTLIFFGIILLVFYLYISALNFNIPIIGFLKGMSFAEVSQLRSMAGNSFVGKAYRYQIFYVSLSQLFLAITFSYCLVANKCRRRWKVLFIIQLGFAIFVAVMNAEKAPIVLLGVLLLLVYLWSRSKILSMKFVVRLFFTLLLVAVLMVYFISFHGERSFSTAVSTALDRLFVGTISPFYYWQKYVEHTGFLYGSTFPNPKDILPFKSVPITKVVMNYSGTNSLKGVTGSMPTAYWSEGYVNFGIAGVFLWVFLMSLIVLSFQRYFVKKMIINKHPINIGVYCYVIVFFISHYVTGLLSSMLIDVGLFLPLIVYYIVRTLSVRKVITR